MQTSAVDEDLEKYLTTASVIDEDLMEDPNQPLKNKVAEFENNCILCERVEGTFLFKLRWLNNGKFPSPYNGAYTSYGEGRNAALEYVRKLNEAKWKRANRDVCPVDLEKLGKSESDFPPNTPFTTDSPQVIAEKMEKAKKKREANAKTASKSKSK